MLSKNIIVSSKSFYSEHKHDLVHSNAKYIEELLNKNISRNNLSEDALKSYYVHCYLSTVEKEGLFNFVEKFYFKTIELYYIHEGLKAIKAFSHLELLKNTLLISHKKLELFLLFDTMFMEFQKKENLIELNSSWLRGHSALVRVEKQEQNNLIRKQLREYSKKEEYIETIEKFCSRIDEKFLRITAKDDNNIFTKSYYFKTTKGYYYVIEKDTIATLYNSYTKKPISTIHLDISPQIVEEKSNSFFNLLTHIDNSIQSLYQVSTLLFTTHTKKRPADEPLHLPYA